MDDLTQRLQAALGEAYLIERTLGQGGFAVVYLVADVKLKRKLAVKVLSPDLITSKTVLERFRREAETVAQLSHPNIVPLHFVGEQEDLLYLAMAYVDGGSLADRTDREGMLPVAEARRAMREVASALAHAHKRGVVHRDIKPQNVLLDGESGRCLVADFGIARTAEGGSLTATGMMVGTPAYLAPEQVTGEPSDHRADIFSLGVMMYEALAGKSPFEGLTPTAVLMHRLAGPPEPLHKVRPDVPRELSDIVQGCLATDPAERFQQASEVVRALGGETSGDVSTRQVRAMARSRRSSRALFIGVGAVVLVAVAAALWARRVSPGGTPVALAPVDTGMVLIPAGDYPIGSDAGPPNARPAHQVHLAAFGIDRREVTRGAYQVYVDAGKAVAPWTGAPGPLDLPVTMVGWSEANHYCEWRHPDGGQLPSEQEWEAAARGVKGRAYPWGETFGADLANTATSRRGGPAPVGSYPRGATPEGIVDLIGNVWEWTRSVMQPYPGAPAAATSGPPLYVIRGGASNSNDAIATAVFRGAYPPFTTPDQLRYTGFRCAMPARVAAAER